MDWIEAFILGIVQGLTEYLPVSSSGHLAIGAALLGTDGAENLTFAIVVHVATVLSTLVVLWSEVVGLLRGLLRLRWNDETRYVALILVSMIPVGIVGVLFKDDVERVFGSGLTVVGVCLLVTAALLAFSSYYRPRPKSRIGFVDAFVIGIAQAAAVLPGLSRSGATISTGLLLGNDKAALARFSFLMVIPPIVGEALLDGLKVAGGEALGSDLPTTSLVVGFVSAFVSGCLACRWMISLVRRGRLIWFAAYCAVVGILALVLS